LNLFSIILAERIIMKDYARIDSFVIITRLKSLKMNGYSTISRFSYISGTGKLLLNERSFIGSRCVINTSSGDVTIGDYSALGPRSTIYTHGTFLPVTHGYSKKNKGVNIGSFTWIMQNSSIGPGIEIGSNSIVLPGSILVKKIPNNVVVYDTPVERKSFPISLFKKELSDIDIEELIKKITHKYIDDLKIKRKTISSKESKNSIEINSNNQRIIIHFDAPNLSITEKVPRSNQVDCFFWYKIDEEIMSTTQYFVLDFYKITYSKIFHPALSKDYRSLMFYEFGLKFINSK